MNASIEQKVESIKHATIEQIFDNVMSEIVVASIETCEGISYANYVVLDGEVNEEIIVNFKTNKKYDPWDFPFVGCGNFYVVKLTPKTDYAIVQCTTNYIEPSEWIDKYPVLSDVHNLKIRRNSCKRIFLKNETM